ncbi:putative transcriptional regulatory protein [Wickerhamomyces ciferrii]|uniref:Transcriptional regulatory protein n=1 Tax=Wickerhamomyces ciferrii (strain ATCC 14091 / BCRC 22168 / CBS 111 / JCM 3599 / NBRC 0793 / NRRL Y-1031 F-60-10) TaxID=1206466 RepID=K0KNR2_WICCF|nr:putative transcriptional regulatory protein [Wickerhamomyces ciferrii]CCH44626.1 putative transcriptional regulatory protein [Wickerhamomyces ciferrii]
MNPQKRVGKSLGDGQRKKKIKRVSSACQVCRRKKIKCNGENPCMNCVNYNVECQYSIKADNKPSDTDDEKTKVTSLKKKAMILAQNLENYEISDHQLESFETISKQIDSLSNTLDHESTSKESGNEVELCSREASYYTQCRKARFWEFMRGRHVVDPIFGLHNTISIFSIAGRAWMSSRLATLEKQFKIEEPILSKKSSEFFSKSYRSAIRVLSADLKLWSESLSSNEWFQIIHTELDFKAVKLIIEGIYEDELKSRHFSTKRGLLEILEKLSSDIELIDCAYFPLICLLIRVNKQNVQLHKNQDVKLKIKSSTLIKFGVRLFQRLMFSFHGNFESLKGLVQFMESLESPYISTFPTGLLTCAIDIGKNNGLHIMEYYVGNKEEESDERRQVFWKLFVMDKWNYLADGKDLRIPHTEVSTFLPSKIHDVMIHFDQGNWDYNSLISYISFFEIEVSKIVSKMYQNLFSTGELEYSKTLVLETLAELQKIQISMIPQVKPGNPIQITGDQIPESEVQRIHLKALHFHLFYYLSINFLLRNSLDSLDHVHESTVLDYDLKILDVFFEFGSFNVNYKLSYVKFTLASACDLVYLYIKNPFDVQYSNKALKYILKYSSILYSQSIKVEDYDHWEMTNAMFNTLVSPCVDIYEMIERNQVAAGDQNSNKSENLVKEIESFKVRLMKFDEMIANEKRQDHLFALDQILNMDLTDVDGFLQSVGLNNGSFYNSLL